MRTSPLVLSVATLLGTLAASIALAKDPCPKVPPADIQACVELEKRKVIPLEAGRGAVGMDDTSFYVFHEVSTGEHAVQLLRIPIAGGPSVVLSNEVGYAAPDDSYDDALRLIIGATHLYWARIEDGIFAVPKKGGEISPIVDPGAKQERFVKVVSDGRQLYWANGDQEIWQRPLDGGTRKRRVRRPHDIEHLIFARGKLLWLERSEGALTLVSMATKTGKLGKVALAGEDYAFDLAADDRFAYVGTYGAIKQVPLAGGQPEVLVKQSAERIVLGTSSVFYVPYEGNCGGGHLMKVSKKGGAPIEMERCESIRNLIAHEGRLFFVGPGGIGSLSE